MLAKKIKQHKESQTVNEKKLDKFCGGKRVGALKENLAEFMFSVNQQTSLFIDVDRKCQKEI